MAEYYLTLVRDHPLLEYIEDPFCENDNSGYKLLKTNLEESFPWVKIGMQNIVKESRLEKVVDVTRPMTVEEIEQERALSSQQNRPLS